MEFASQNKFLERKNDDSCRRAALLAGVFFVTGYQDQIYAGVIVIKMLEVFTGGGIGSVLRYAMSTLMYSEFGTDFPYGTFAVNIIGSFVIGLFLTIAEDRFLVSPEMRAFVAIGVIGGFTTFSTFTYETLGLFKDGSFLFGVINIVASITVALFAAWLGNLIGKLI